MDPASFDLGGLPPLLTDAVRQALHEAAGGQGTASLLPTDSRLCRELPRVLACSPYVAALLPRDPQLLAGLAGADHWRQPQAPADYRERAVPLTDPALSAAGFVRELRRFRHREMVSIICRDLLGLVDIDQSLAELSALADVAICTALDRAALTLRTRYGVPRDDAGREAQLAVVAMGKLGGRELNFSSDVDLVFIYSGPGETDGPKAVSNEEYFRLLAQQLVGLLSEKTDDGFVYRVDVRLRPFGDSGPLAVSLEAFENYLAQHGRDWERYAWIKARVVNDWPDTGYLCNELLRPFVYRRYLDYGVFSSLRDMKSMIEVEVARREFQHNLKLGPGGIREIEFIVQSLQLARGGSRAELREPELLRVLPRLATLGLVPPADAAALAQAYRYLRTVENRIQAMRDQQTHELPEDATDRARLAFAMGNAGWEDFCSVLAVHQQTVARSFREVVFRNEDAGEAAAATPGLRALWADELAAQAAGEALAAAGFRDPAAALELLRRLRSASIVQRLDEPGRQRLDLLIPAVLRMAGKEPESLRALAGVIAVIESIGRRSAYFALLNENPAACERLVALCGMSSFLAEQVAAHPLLLDELLDPRLFSAPPTRDELAADLAGRLQGIGVNDTERRFDALRNFQQAARFRVAVADLSGILPLMKVSDRLTETAELVLQGACEMARHELTARHGVPRCGTGTELREAGFAIIAYGKLGGLELGYSSDLDVVFLHDSAGEVQETAGAAVIENDMFFARLARRIISIVTMPTGRGHLYEVDTRLRPSGRAGLLVSDLAAFEHYQRDDAWTWEHQALLRSRGIAGSRAVCGHFEELRVRVLRQYVHRDRLRTDVLEMRARMAAELARGTPENFDIKHDRGGITDIEFIVQYLVLRHAGDCPELVRYPDNIRQLEALAVHGFLRAETAAVLADHYRGYRERLHRLALAGEPGFLPRAVAEAMITAVTAIWDEVFAA